MSDSLPPGAGDSGRGSSERLGTVFCQTLAILFAIPFVAILVACGLQGLADPDVPYGLAHYLFPSEKGTAGTAQAVPFIVFYRYGLFLTTLMAAGQILAAVRRAFEDYRV
jgi:hypothetical protein